MQFIGEQIFAIKEIQQTRHAILKKPLFNAKNTRLEMKMKNELITRVVMRYEEVEQTNNMIKLQFKVNEFDEKGGLIFKLFRNRSLGEFVEVYESGRRKNFPDTGCTWKEFTLPLRQLARNDYERPLKYKVYRSRAGGKVQTYLAECEFNVLQLRDTTKPINCMKKLNLIGNVEILKFQEFNKYTFLDYIYGGMNIQLYLAIDLTKGNGELHHYNPDHVLEESESDEDDGKENAGGKDKRGNIFGENMQSQVHSADDSLQRIQITRMRERDVQKKKFMLRDIDNEY